MVGPVCYSNPGKPHTVCRIVRSQYVAAALLSVGVTVLTVLIAIVIIELYSRKIYEPRLTSAGNIYKIKKNASTDAASVDDKSVDLEEEEEEKRSQNSTELHWKNRDSSRDKSHIV